MRTKTHAKTIGRGQFILAQIGYDCNSTHINYVVVVVVDKSQEPFSMQTKRFSRQRADILSAYCLSA